MFREALEVARGNQAGDAWAVSRALVGIANVLSLSADEEEALAVGLEALTVGEEAEPAASRPRWRTRPSPRRSAA